MQQLARGEFIFREPITVKLGGWQAQLAYSDAADLGLTASSSCER